MNEPEMLFPEIREIPNNFFTVIADDEPYFAKRTEGALLEGFSSGDKIHGATHIVNKVMDLLELALFGNEGGQADVVLLDDLYLENYGDWRPTDKELLLLAERCRIDFSPFVIPDRPLVIPDQDIPYDQMPDSLHFPNSTHFAMLLRILGYKNGIFAISSNPPEVRDIKKTVSDLAKYTPKYIPEFPINGFSLKKPVLGECYFSRTIGLNRWEAQFVKGGLTQALQKLFTSQPIK